MKYTETQLLPSASGTAREAFPTTLPVTPKGIIDFLAGDMVEGIGPAYAKRLVNAYGEDTVRRLRDEPESICGVPGLGSARVATASESLKKIRHPIDLILFLYSCGIKDLFITRILGKYRSHAREIIITDPYQMVEDVWRLSFFTADRIGKLSGVADDDPRRARGALLTAIKHYAEDGHLFATPEQAIAYASEISGIDPDRFPEAVDSLADEGRIIRSRGGLYLPVYYEAERNGAKRLMELASAPIVAVDESEIPSYDVKGNEYSPEQRDAIRIALQYPVSVLTGGPGSGKTTVLKGIMDILDLQGKKVLLAAPTGRAAKRMSTLTGHEAQTIHRLLGYREGEGYFNKSIDTDVLIIDEGSMMEQVLFDHLLQAVKSGTKIIMVGDADQLPAIGAGDVLRDLMASSAVPVTILDKNFRQAAGSRIASGARAINQGEMPENTVSEDFIIIPASGPKEIHERILELVGEELPEKYGIRPDEIQVVTPQQMGPLGARQLNSDLRERLNPDGPEIRRGTSVMRLGDPVMQTANSSARGLYNGETGRISHIDPEGKFLIVEFADGKESRYDRSELSELTPAYATTVHKLQGSEVEYMVMPVTMAHKPMLYRNLLYTGVSRARKLCVLVGEEDALRFAVENTRHGIRNSNFKSRLKDRK